MLKPWSLTTTVRNPERLRDFLIALQPLAGKQWSHKNQENYQKLLIKSRLYGYGNQQFYRKLPKEVVDVINDIDKDIDDSLVTKILNIKQYQDFPMRGRQSLNPLKKLGFVSTEDGVLKITSLGHKFITSDKDAGNVFLKSFLKWQIPNPASDDYESDGHYNIVPFVATLKLISEVNKIERQNGNKAVGISKREFCLFVPTLVNYHEIERTALKISQFRELQKNKSAQVRKKIRDNYRKEFAKSFLNTDDELQISKLLTNLHDYGDNAIRYFRLTKFIRIRGNGFFVDLERSRHTEIESLFENKFFKPNTFDSRKTYVEYMSNEDLPELPWQTLTKLKEIAREVDKDVEKLESKLGLSSSPRKSLDLMSTKELTVYIDDTREMRKDLQEKDNHIKSQPIESIANYIEQLEGIFEMESRALMLEYLSTMGLHALNDAVEIKPNYPVGDDNEPTSTAPGGMADIECFYQNFSLICEVTMLSGRDQWFNEGQPVMRHLRDFENKHKNSYCIFIAPSIHPDSAETFWIANTIGYKGKKQKIAPITINQYVEILRYLQRLRKEDKKFTSGKLLNLINSITLNALIFSDSDDWIMNIQSLIRAWARS